MTMSEDVFYLANYKVPRERIGEFAGMIAILHVTKRLLDTLEIYGKKSKPDQKRE